MPAAPIHHAIGNAEWARCRELLAGPDGGDLAAIRGRSGATALVQALRKAAPSDVLELMLQSPSAALAAKARVRHQTAADVAQDLGLSCELVQRLQELQRSIPDAPGKLRCAVCGDELAKRSALLALGERVEKGDEPNPLVRNFFDQPASAAFMQTALHRAANCHNFRQEVSESMAIVGSLRKWRQWDEEALHFVDLCCGSAMTATFLALSAPKSTVTAVDIRPPQHLPHFREAGIANVRYLCEDMTRPGFLDVMEKALLDVALPAIVLGMHCCGALSVVATQIYNRFPQCVAILLCPCCLLRNIDVKRADSLMPEVPKSLLSLSEARPEERYERWAQGLAQLLPEATCERLPDMLTPCNAMIFAQKSRSDGDDETERHLTLNAPALWTSKSLEAAHWDRHQQVEVLWLLAQLRAPKTGFAADHVQRETAARISEEPGPWEAVTAAK
eukprot:s2481_g2.t3